MTKLLMTIAVVGLFVAPAFAALPPTGQVDNQNFGVAVTVEVKQEVSMWAGASAALVLQGNNPENSDAVASSIYHINNVNADISAQVDGEGDALLNVNFFIFDGGTVGDATAAMAANADAPAGALAWTQATLGTPLPFASSVAVSQNVTTRGIVYAADAPNVMPLPDAYNLVVTWTIAISL